MSKNRKCHAYDVELTQNTSRSRRACTHLFSKIKLDDKVARHAQEEDAHEVDDLPARADERAVDEGNDEAERLPHSVVAERRFAVARENTSVESCNRSCNYFYVYERNMTSFGNYVDVCCDVIDRWV